MIDQGGLYVADVYKSFGLMRVLEGVDLHVPQGKAVGLIGPNGAGKTTLVNCITGVIRVDRGEIRLGGELITGREPFELARFGLNRTFQIPKPFGALTVCDNIKVATRIRERADDTRDVLELFGLWNKKDVLAAELNVCEQKQLDLARAVATGACTILVDEAGAGLSANELKELARTLRSLVEQHKIALLVIEHIMEFVDAVADEVNVLSSGKIIFRGGLSGALRDEEVLRVFVGG